MLFIRDGLACRECCDHSRNVIECTHHPLPPVPGWVKPGLLSHLYDARVPNQPHNLKKTY